MDTVFGKCVSALQAIARATGTTYETVNVVIFCMIWPAVTIALVVALGISLCA